MADNPWDEKPDDKLKATLDKARDGSPREWRLIEKLLMGLHAEQRRSRRWGIFFKLLTFLYLFALLGIFLVGKDLGQEVVAKEHTALINVRGPIADGEEASADRLVGALRDAFKERKSHAVILRINSPGGSPVQAGYVYDEIKRLRGLHPDKKVYAVISDIGASGAYYIAAAADEIYADKASLVGSIGVTSAGFGFVELMDKVGVERRALASGEHKTFLDPFSPLKESEKAFWQGVLGTTHQQFIDQVKAGRGERLKDDDRLFSGLVWSGEQALELGLVDGLMSSSAVARDIVGFEELVEYGPKPSPLDQLIDRLGVSFAGALATELGLGGASQLR
ncbi:S49 family peptidase [Marinobacterium aestuariivivens]|uniref:S49 family peptidase n=1 Tax=Marinobacterium aestuariivivens TaxID=1698799 RepID=A0ABW2A8G1_9GAMM